MGHFWYNNIYIPIKLVFTVPHWTRLGSCGQHRPDSGPVQASVWVSLTHSSWNRHMLHTLLWLCTSRFYSYFSGWLHRHCGNSRTLQWRQMTVNTTQFICLSTVCSTVYSSLQQRKHRSSASLAFLRGTHGSPWIPLTKGQWQRLSCHDVNMTTDGYGYNQSHESAMTWQRTTNRQSTTNPCAYISSVTHYMCMETYSPKGQYIACHRHTSTIGKIPEAFLLFRVHSTNG